MKDIIILAEAQGWERYADSSVPMWRTPPILIQRFEDKPGQQSLYGELVNEDELPDPFTDANDDYAYLLFARKNWLTGNMPKWEKFCQAIMDDEKLFGSLLYYYVGAYAKSFLKAIL